MNAIHEYPQTPPGPSVADRYRSAVQQRMTGLPAWVLVTQLFIGLGWLRAAIEKIIDPGWWQGDALARFLIDHDSRSLGWYEPFLDVVIAPHLIAISAVVILAQLFAAASLLSGRAQLAALAVGMFLNLNFLAAGAVNPSAFYLMSQGALALWLVERVHVRSTRPLLAASAISASILALISVPFITTIDPALMIDDPALMMITGGSLTVIASYAAHLNLTESRAVAAGRMEQSPTSTSTSARP